MTYKKCSKCDRVVFECVRCHKIIDTNICTNHLYDRDTEFSVCDLCFIQLKTLNFFKFSDRNIELPFQKKTVLYNCANCHGNFLILDNQIIFKMCVEGTFPRYYYWTNIYNILFFCRINTTLL